ncbi:MAG TPA: hypothetical protein PLX89_05315, partial [Verrucomicrobiota bacterium]|nr:hypothetical protein [Verrucomicrobiota bacterium]
VVRTTGTDGYVIADAIQLTRVTTLTTMNSNAMDALQSPVRVSFIDKNSGMGITAIDCHIPAGFRQGYLVERSGDLVNWVQVGAPPFFGHNIEIDVTGGEPPQQFYRLTPINVDR